MERKKYLILVLVAGLTAGLTVVPCTAVNFDVFDRPAHVTGYITQGVGFGLYNSYDTINNVQSALMNLFAEGDYRISNQLKFYASGRLTVDWIYQLNANRDLWHERLFDQSKQELNVDSNDWQLLNEAHVTWTPGDFSFRVGKQIVAWGETDGLRLIDQINPLDQRRGFADVEFENTIIPTWLVKAEYFPRIQSSWLDELNFQFVFNPNAEFIRNQGIKLGNNEGGIWAPNVLISGPFPFGAAHLGSTFNTIEKPEAFNSAGYQYAFRVKGAIKGAVVTLNYFYGLNNDFVSQTEPIPPQITVASDGRLIIHPFQRSKYPLFRFVGGTFSKDIQPLQASFLGGVAPVVRLEGIYVFGNTFVTTLNRFWHSDEFRAVLGLDWKVKIPFLNYQTYFTISPQFFYRYITDFPKVANISGLQSEELPGVKQNNYVTTLLVNTQYFHGRLTPTFFWFYDITTKSNFFKVEVKYDYNDWWHFSLGTLLFTGDKPNQGFQVFDHKDQIYFKISYKFS